LLFDVKQIRYSQVKSIANEMIVNTLMPMIPSVPLDPDNLFVPNPEFIPLGDENAAGFGWQDMTVIKVGFEAVVAETWQLRAGYSYGKQPIQESQVMFNILAPAVNENHISMGLTKVFKQHELNFAVTHALNNTITGMNPLDPAQQIELNMNQWEFEIGFAF
jgi:long-chain fatty acid transport protein